MSRTSISILLSVVSLSFSSAAHARDWFVRAGAAGGDGSRAKPFGDPWEALERVEAGDKVHVAEGRYFGKLEAGNWVIPFPNVQLLGGYDAAFRERDPWRRATELAWRKESPTRPNVSLARVSDHGGRDTPGAVVDGFLIDMQSTYEYGAAGLLPISMARPGAVDLSGAGSALRNCLIVNAVDAVRVRPGVIVENNVIVNSVRVAVSARGGSTSDPPAILRNNTIAFVWDPRVPGKGGPGGIGIDAGNAVRVEGNLIVHADNHAVSLTQGLSRSAVAGNAFHRNLYANLRFYLDSKESAADDGSMDTLDEVGLAKADGNVIADPQLPFASPWYDTFLQRTAGKGKQYDAAAWAETRKAAGLPPSSATSEVFAPPYPAASLASLVAPKNAAVKAGARARQLAVALGPAVAAAVPVRAWQRTTPEALAASPPSFEGKAVEVIGGMSGVTNTGGVAGVGEATHTARWLVSADGRVSIAGYVQKGTQAQRDVDAVANYGSGPPRELYLIRGVARVVYGRSAGIVIDTVERYERPAVATPRPKGRDYVLCYALPMADVSRSGAPIAKAWTGRRRRRRAPTGPGTWRSESGRRGAGTVRSCWRCTRSCGDAASCSRRTTRPVSRPGCCSNRCASDGMAQCRP